PAIDVIIGPMMEDAEPDETGYLPTPYEMGGPGEMIEMFRTAGFEDARERYAEGAMGSDSVEGYWNMLMSATPIGHSFHEEDPAVQETVRKKCLENIAKYRQPDGSVS